MNNANTVRSSQGRLVTPRPTKGLEGRTLSDAKKKNKKALENVTRPAPTNQAKEVDANTPPI